MQYELNLRDYIRIFQKRKWIVILMPILAGILGYLLTPEPPTLHEARGKVRISKRIRPTEALLDAFYYYEEGSPLDTHAAVMTSREVLKEVATCLGLVDTGKDPRNGVARCGDGRELVVVSDAELRAHDEWLGHIQQLQESISAAAVPATSILEITVTHDREEWAVTSLNTLLDTYAARHTYETNRAIIDGLGYLEEQLERVTDDLHRAEEALTRFRTESGIAAGLGTDEIRDAQADLQATERRIRTLEFQIELIDEGLRSGTVPSFDLLPDADSDSLQIAQLRSELLALEQQRLDLLAFQTAASPEVAAVRAQIRDRLGLLRDLLESTRESLAREQQRLERRFQAIPANDVVLAGLERDLRVNEELYGTLLAQLQTARLRDTEKTQEVTVIERAVDATQVSETGRGSKALIAAIIGVLLGVIAALVVETLDTSIGAIEDVEALLDVPVIGIVPPIDFDEIRSVVRGIAPDLLDHADAAQILSLVSHYEPRSPVAEAYRALRTNVEKVRSQGNDKVVVVTSSVLEEGKTTTSANLALAFAQMGRKTLLIAADLRRPNLHRVFGLEKEPGLADVLTGSVAWESAVRELSDVLLGELSMEVVMLTPGMDNLHILPSGSNPLNPAELLGSDATARLLRELRDAFDLIIIDTPPILPVTDSAILAEHTDGVLIVYEVGKVGRDVLKRAKTHLENVHADVWGIVMNDVKAEAETTLRDTDYYYYRYRYDEGSEGRGPLAALGRAASRIFRSR